MSLEKNPYAQHRNPRHHALKVGGVIRSLGLSEDSQDQILKGIATDATEVIEERRLVSRQRAKVISTLAATALLAATLTASSGAIIPKDRGAAEAAATPPEADVYREYIGKHQHPARSVALTECIDKLPDNSYWGKAKSDINEVAGKHRAPVAATNALMVLIADDNESRFPNPDRIEYSVDDCFKVPTKSVVRAVYRATADPASNPQLAKYLGEINKETLAHAMAMDTTLDAVRANLRLESQQPYQGRHQAQ